MTKTVKTEREIEIKFVGHHYETNTPIYEMYEYYIVKCPICGYICDATFTDKSNFPSLLDDVCEHFRFTEEINGEIWATFSKESRPEINPFKRY